MQISQHSVVHSCRLQQPTHKPLHLQQEPLSSLIDVIADAQGPEWPADQRQTRKPEKEVFLAGTERRGGGGSDWSLSSPLKQHMQQHCAPNNLSFLSIPFCFAQSCHPQSVYLPVWLHFVLGNKFGYGENVILMLTIYPHSCHGRDLMRFLSGVQNCFAWSLTSHRMANPWFVKSL